MISVILISSFFVICPAAGQYDSTQLDELSGKFLNAEEYEAKKGFGYLSEFDTSKILCSVALINLETVIADAYCVPDGTNVSKIYVVFGEIFNLDELEIALICEPEYIKEEETNTTLVVLSLINEVTENNFISPLQIWGLPFVDEGPGYILGWNEHWHTTVDDIQIPAMIMESRTEISFSRTRAVCNLPVNIGQLVARKKMLLAFTLMNQNTPQRIVYLYLGKLFERIEAAKNRQKNQKALLYNIQQQKQQEEKYNYIHHQLQQRQRKMRMRLQQG